jgi:phosphate-selective porin
VSVAAGVYYKEKIYGSLQYRSRPEANQSPNLVDTAKFAANHSTTTPFEVMAMRGSTQVFGERMLTPVSAPTVGNPVFHGGFIGVSHFLTGEHRTFNREDGHYASTFAPPHRSALDTPASAHRVQQRLRRSRSWRTTRILQCVPGTRPVRILNQQASTA